MGDLAEAQQEIAALRDELTRERERRESLEARLELQRENGDPSEGGRWRIGGLTATEFDPVAAFGRSATGARGAHSRGESDGCAPASPISGGGGGERGTVHADFRWRKVLWMKQPCEDNYVPPDFLAQARPSATAARPPFKRRRAWLLTRLRAPPLDISVARSSVRSHILRRLP